MRRGKFTKLKGVIILGDSADWPEKHFSGQTAGRNLNTSGFGLEYDLVRRPRVSYRDDVIFLGKSLHQELFSHGVGCRSFYLL